MNVFSNDSLFDSNFPVDLTVFFESPFNSPLESPFESLVSRFPVFVSFFWLFSKIPELSAFFLGSFLWLLNLWGLLEGSSSESALHVNLRNKSVVISVQAVIVTKSGENHDGALVKYL